MTTMNQGHANLRTLFDAWLTDVYMAHPKAALRVTADREHFYVYLVAADGTELQGHLEQAVLDGLAVKVPRDDDPPS
jgi:hypothetical protein